MIISAAIKRAGRIYTGRRHHNIIADNPPKYFVGEGAVQGFVDEAGNFLDRREAATHALACGQITKLKFSTLDLFSEDIY